MTFHYTYNEINVLRHDVGFIVKQVKSVLANKRVRSICLSQLPDDNGQLYTTEQASRIIDAVVNDSLYYHYP